MSFRKSEGQNRKTVVITRQVADSIITWAKTHHPNEAILVLQGKSTREQIAVDGVVIPPFSESGPFYSGFGIHDLPYTIPHVGTAHSHPGGSNHPSLEDRGARGAPAGDAGRGSVFRAPLRGPDPGTRGVDGARLYLSGTSVLCRGLAVSPALDGGGKEGAGAGDRSQLR